MRSEQNSHNSLTKCHSSVRSPFKFIGQIVPDVEHTALASNLARAVGNEHAVDNLIKKCVRSRKKVPSWSGDWFEAPERRGRGGFALECRSFLNSFSEDETGAMRDSIKHCFTKLCVCLVNSVFSFCREDDIPSANSEKGSRRKGFMKMKEKQVWREVWWQELRPWKSVRSQVLKEPCITLGAVMLARRLLYLFLHMVSLEMALLCGKLIIRFEEHP